MKNELYNKLYEFYCYLSEEQPGKIFENEPDRPWIKVVFKEPEWWMYNKLIHGTPEGKNDCFFRIQNTGRWSINEIKKRRFLRKYGVIRVETSDGIIKTGNDIYFNDEEGELLGVYYNEKILLSDEEANRISNDLDIYKNKKYLKKLKPPFHRMIIELDIMKYIGKYNREDILNMSKKDLDIIYYLNNLGMNVDANFAELPDQRGLSEDQKMQKRYEDIKMFQQRNINKQNNK